MAPAEGSESMSLVGQDLITVKARDECWAQSLLSLRSCR